MSLFTSSTTQPGMNSSFIPAAEDRARADFYSLISHFLQHPPSNDLLDGLSSAGSLGAQDASSALEQAWQKLVTAASVTHADAVREEFNELFISTGTPLVNPYASLYLAGFLNEKPLANLRADLQSLGLRRAPGIYELEDHLSGLCDAMRVMITGEQGGQAQALQQQRDFFRTYIYPWYSRCLFDIRSSSGTRFYALVADFSEAFFDIEAQAFDMIEVTQAEEMQGMNRDCMRTMP